MGWRKFLLFDAIGALAWVSMFTITGYVFSGNWSASRQAPPISESGCWSSCWPHSRATFCGNIYKRQKFLSDLKIARITPEELKEKMDAGEDILVVDLRHALDFRRQSGNDFRRAARRCRGI